MPQITVLQPFKFAHGGHTVEEFEPGPQPRETTAECAELAVREGWASLVGEERALDAAPENKDAARKRATKAAG